MASAPRHVDPRIGVKLPLGWRTDAVWQGLARPADNLFADLRSAGAGHVEYATSSAGDPATERLTEEEIAACAEAGLTVGFHPYFRPEDDPAHFEQSASCRRAVDHLLELAQRAAEARGDEAFIVFHPAAAFFDPAETTNLPFRVPLLRASKLFAEYLERAREGIAPRVRVYVEHQSPTYPRDNLVRTGEYYEELLDAVRDTGLPLCWDTGHYLCAVRLWAQPEEPSDEFVRRVGHVHLHDVRDERDHLPIRPDSDRVRGYMRRLWENGFRGTVTLEYSEEGLEQGGGLRNALLRGAECLSRWASESR